MRPDHEGDRFVDLALETRFMNIIPQYNFDTMTHFEQGIIGMYFIFTSLTTVGFGDYTPHSDSERLSCAFLLLFGVLL